MKVLYDHQIFEHQRIGGVSRYFSEIIKNMSTDINCDVCIQYSFNEYLKNIYVDFDWKDQLLTQFLPNLNFRGKKRLLIFLQQNFPNKFPDYYQLNKQATINKIKEGDFDLFHPTFFDDYFIDYLNDKPYVLTIHDTIIELFPEFINSLGFIERKKRLIDKAAHIIAVSENTKQDIINVYGIEAEKISVIYHGASLETSSNEIIDLPPKYILYVGDRRLGYKNFLFFVSSIQSILLEDKDLYLVCTGDPFTLEELNYFETLGIKDKIKNKFVDDKQMYNLYNKAILFVYPSYYEGFGIPILEAFQASCPVMLANNSCFPEIAKDGGTYFNYKSPKDLRLKIIKLLSNSSLRNQKIEDGKLRLTHFSWKKSAEQTAEVYKMVLNKK